MKQLWGTFLVTVLGLSCLLPAPAPAGDMYVTSADKFRSAPDGTGAGFYWVDSATGRTWLMEAAKTRWVFCGMPEGAAPGPVGTYVPQSNTAGPGVFILNTSTGEGWCYDGKAWKSLGLPAETKP